MREELSELKKIWYSRLKESGFDDAEKVDHPDQPLKVWHSFKFKDALKLQETSDYYIKALHLLGTYAFDNETHKKIWELHAAGMSKRKIEKLIEHDKPKYKRSQIETIIKVIAGAIV